MPSDKLTELGIKKSKSSIKEKKLYDGKGLYLLLHTNGSKYWRVKYRFLGNCPAIKCILEPYSLVEMQELDEL